MILLAFSTLLYTLCPTNAGEKCATTSYPYLYQVDHGNGDQEIKCDKENVFKFVSGFKIKITTDVKRDSPDQHYYIIKTKLHWCLRKRCKNACANDDSGGFSENGESFTYNEDTSADDRCTKRLINATCVAPISGVPTFDKTPLECKECGGESKLVNLRCECNDGHEVHMGNNQCTACPKGEYKDSGKDRCTPCQRGWYNNHTGQDACTMCPPGYYGRREGEDECHTCMEGTFTASAGQTQCTPCSRGRTSGKSAKSCDFCPYASTTYKHIGKGNVCVGPNISIKYNNQMYTFDVPFKMNIPRSFMKSISDWKLYRSSGHQYTLRENFTTRRNGRVLRYRKIVKGEPIIKDVVCYTGKGHDYKGLVDHSASGNKCKKSCRNSSGSGFDVPYCNTENGKEECDIPKCVDNTPADNCDYKDEYSKRQLKIEDSYTYLNLHISDAKDTCDKLALKCIGLIALDGGCFGIVSGQQDVTHDQPVTFLKKDANCIAPYYSSHFEQRYRESSYKI